MPDTVFHIGTSILISLGGSRFLRRHPRDFVLSEKVVIFVSYEIGLGAGLAAERFAGANELKVVQTACDSLVAVAVESIQRNTGTTVYTGIHLRTSQNGIAVSVYNTRCGRGVGVNKVSIFVSGIVGSLNIPVAKRRLDDSQGRN